MYVSEAGRIGKEKKTYKNRKSKTLRRPLFHNFYRSAAHKNFEEEEWKEKAREEEQIEKERREDNEKKSKERERKQRLLCDIFLFYIIKWLRTHEMQKGRKI